MNRVNEILKHKAYLEHLMKIQALEEDRIFCKHDLSHFLDVCRIAWILNLEEQRNLEKEWVYAAGLLHDIGRWAQYEQGVDHALESGRLCLFILEDCSFTLEEQSMIQKAIVSHREEKSIMEDLSSVLFRADKLSRNCWMCSASNQCKKIKNGVLPPLQY